MRIILTCLILSVICAPLFATAPLKRMALVCDDGGGEITYITKSDGTLRTVLGKLEVDQESFKKAQVEFEKQQPEAQAQYELAMEEWQKVRWWETRSYALFSHLRMAGSYLVILGGVVLGSRIVDHYRVQRLHQLAGAIHVAGMQLVIWCWYENFVPQVEEVIAPAPTKPKIPHSSERRFQMFAAFVDEKTKCSGNTTLKAQDLKDGFLYPAHIIVKK